MDNLTIIENMADFRAQERPKEAKAFFMDSENYNGRSNLEKVENPDYLEVRDLYNTCLIYATSYSQVMLNRIQSEKPEFFEEAGVTKDEMAAQVTHNMCLQYQKLKNQIHRRTVASLREQQSLKDDIRRLYNGGDKFHPYL